MVLVDKSGEKPQAGDLSAEIHGWSVGLEALNCVTSL